MHRITVVGSGFAALTAVRRLRKSGVDLDLTLVSPRPEFIYLPGLIWVPSGLRKAQDLRIPLDSFLRRMRVTHLSRRV